MFNFLRPSSSTSLLKKKDAEQLLKVPATPHDQYGVMLDGFTHDEFVTIEKALLKASLTRKRRKSLAIKFWDGIRCEVERDYVEIYAIGPQDAVSTGLYMLEDLGLSISQRAHDLSRPLPRSLCLKGRGKTKIDFPVHHVIARPDFGWTVYLSLRDKNPDGKTYLGKAQHLGIACIPGGVAIVIDFKFTLGHCEVPG